jgi:hypothetical protein
MFTLLEDTKLTQLQDIFQTLLTMRTFKTIKPINQKSTLHILLPVYQLIQPIYHHFNQPILNINQANILHLPTHVGSQDSQQEIKNNYPSPERNNQPIQSTYINQSPSPPN